MHAFNTDNSTPERPKEELFNIGWIENKTSWAADLADLVGKFSRDELNERLKSQRDSSATFCNDELQQVASDIATVRKFDTGYLSHSNGKKVFALFHKRSGKWNGVSFADSASLSNLRTSCDLQLFDFAFLPGDWKTTLSGLAIEEPWTVDERPLGVLHSYLTNTFSRLWGEGKVFSNDECAAFNTGLVDRHYDPIIAFFALNKMTNAKQKWHLKYFCTYGSGPQGKECASKIKSLPQAAKWFDKFDQLYLDPDLEITVSWEHFVYDNIARVPKEVIETYLPNGGPIKTLFMEAQSEQDQEKREEKFKAFVSALEKSSHDFEHFDYNMRGTFSNAISLARKRVRWNFGTAVPMFYPTKKKFSFLLPLSLKNPSDVDVALVVDKDKDSDSQYLGQTILTLGMAYNNARLLRRPETPWLRDFAR